MGPLPVAIRNLLMSAHNVIPPSVPPVSHDEATQAIQENGTQGTGIVGMWPRIFPFATYMAFLAVEGGVRWMDQGSEGEGISHLVLWLYPVKTLAVGILLWWFWSWFSELHAPIVRNVREALVVLGTGIGVYVLWVRMDWPWAMQGEPTAYNPFQVGGMAGLVLGGIRLFGASVIVPIMEELFWRSFLLRYLINAHFERVRLGTFTASSFLVTTVLFGLEHNLWLAGMMAGAAYAGLLYWTHRLWPCVLAHGLTNLILGIHVLVTGEWHWW
ncbi:MAG: CAAX prenyl protease-related protein [Nitrospirae bacterium]|nr:MAG: CAAX prenyl protease-related protein [Nitrospirota bacterium]